MNKKLKETLAQVIKNNRIEFDKKTSTYKITDSRYTPILNITQGLHHFGNVPFSEILYYRPSYNESSYKTILYFQEDLNSAQNMQDVLDFCELYQLCEDKWNSEWIESVIDYLKPYTK